MARKPDRFSGPEQKVTDRYETADRYYTVLASAANAAENIEDAGV